MSNVTVNKMITTSNGSVAITLSQKSAESFYNHDGNECPEWTEVYSMGDSVSNVPISGYYYEIGSSNYIIINKDAIISYKWVGAEGLISKRFPSHTCMLIQPVKQSDRTDIDDVIYYVRIIT